MSLALENDATNLAIGAKRRKPIKTNKVTQIQVKKVMIPSVPPNN